MAAKWLFMLTDIHGNVLGEVTDADQRQVILPLNRMPTAGFVIRTNHPLADYVTDPNWDGLLKCYRNNSLRFVGPIVGGNETGDAKAGNSIAVTAAGPLWRLLFRLLGNTPAGWSLGDATTTYDLGHIAMLMLDDANSRGYTGITKGTEGASENGSAGVYYFKPVSDAITEMSTGINSFDYEVAPVEPHDIGLTWPEIGKLNVANLIGSAKPNSIFEYGTSKANLSAYGRNITRDGLCTFGYIEQPASTDHSGTLTSVDAAAEALRGRYEALVDNGGVTWDILRQALVDENVKIRKQARQVMTVTPVMNSAPQPFNDYIVGDQVRARIFVDRKKRLDGMLRVWGITFNMDKSGNEAVSLELIQP